MRGAWCTSVLAAALMSGCAADESAGTSNDQGFSSDMGAAFDLNSCPVVKVTPSFGTAPVTLTAVAMVSTAAAPTWTVSTPSGFLTPTALDPSGLSVSLQATEPGTYIFHVDLSGGESFGCPGEGSAEVLAPQAASQAYRVRLTPPASAGLPQQDRLITVYGNTPLGAQTLMLDAGSAFGGVLHTATGPVAGEVHLIPQSGPEYDVAVGASGSFSLPIRLDATYTVVLVPADPMLAPRAVGPLLGAALSSSAMQVDAGEPVTGMVRDDAAAALAGARVALRVGPLPSGLGTSAVDGSFALRAAAGTYRLAAAADGWPELSLDGVVVPAGGVSVSIDQALARNTVALRVVRADGTTPVAGAQVSLRSAPLPAAAQITAGGGSPQGATGVAHLVLTSASDGTLGSVSLPSAAYDVLVEAVDVGSGVIEGTTGLSLDVSGSGSVDLKLAAHQGLAGHVRDGKGAAVVGARVRAVPSGGKGATRATVTDATGAFSLLLAAGVPADLVVDPPPGVPLASARVHLGATAGALGGALPATAEVTLPPGLQISGTVRGPNASVLPGVAVDVLCLSCTDPTPLAHAVSDGSGGYVLALPDPGLLLVDGGTD